MKKSLISSVILSSVIGLSSAAFASTALETKTMKAPVKVQSKMMNSKKVVVKPFVKNEKKVNHKLVKAVSEDKKTDGKLINHETKKIK